MLGTTPIYVVNGALPLPVISSLNFSTGDIAGGGQSIVITGTKLSSASAVTIGGNSATITNNTSTNITFTLPAHAAAPVDLTVTTPLGTSLPFTFTYWSPLSLSNIDTYLDANKGWSSGTWTDQNSARTWGAGGGTAGTQTANVFGSLPSIRFSQASSTQQVASVARTFGTSAASSGFIIMATSTSDTSATNPNDNVPLTALGWSAGWNGFGLSGGHPALQSFNSAGTVSSSLIASSTIVNDGTPYLMGYTCSGSGLTFLYLGVGNAVDSVASSSFGIQVNGIDRVGIGFGPADGWTGDIGAVIITTNVLATNNGLTTLHDWAKQRFNAF